MTEAADDYLSPSQIRGLTGRAHHEKQLAWLRLNGWPHEVNGAGRILVLRSYWHGRMSGNVDTKTPTTHAHQAHNFGALKAA